MKKYDDEYYSTGIDPYEPTTERDEGCSWLIGIIIFLILVLSPIFWGRR